MHWYIEAFKKYLVFSGRSSRRAFWMFVLFDIIFSIVLSIIDAVLGKNGGILSGLYALATIPPYISVGVRRLHDTGRSGWWILFPIMNILFFCFDSEQGDNKYGPSPRNAMI